jgi:hypothetical protein
LGIESAYGEERVLRAKAEEECLGGDVGVLLYMGIVDGEQTDKAQFSGRGKVSE